MPDLSNASKQLDDYLPGMTPPKGVLQPHQLSPNEFAAHPNAVFHSTHLSDEDMWNPSKRFNKTEVMHFGTEQSAIDRHLSTGTSALRQREKYGNTVLTVDAKLHTFHHDPGTDKPEMGVDSIENDMMPGTRYYRNEYEDPGTISLATSDRSRIKSHSDFVKTAIDSGKSDEVHPQTMAMYKAGALKSGRHLPLSETKRHTGFTPANTELELPKSETDSMPFHDIGPSHDPHVGWYAGNMGSTRGPRISDYGPHYDTLTAHARKAYPQEGA